MIFTGLFIALGEDRRVSLPEPENFIPLSAEVSAGEQSRKVILFSQREAINILSPCTVLVPGFKSLIAKSLIPGVNLMP